MSPLTYEQALAELQAIVADLQEDAIGIEQLSDRMQRAAELIQYCREKLRKTEEDLERLFEEEA